MAKNDVDKLHEQKAERGKEGGRGEKEGKKGEKNKPVDSRPSREECILQSRTEAGRTGEMEGGGGEIMRA